jgi:hypothetical protein
MAMVHELAQAYRSLEEPAIAIAFQPDNPQSSYSEDVQGGVVAARRKVSSKSYYLFEQIISRIEFGLTEKTNFVDNKDLGVSVISYYQLFGLNDVPPTSRITESISSAYNPMLVRLGRLAFFGKRLSLIDNNDTASVLGAKLVLELDDHKLNQEAQSYLEQYALRGINLNPYPGDKKYHPHCTLAEIIAPAGYFKDPLTAAEFNRLADLRGLGLDSQVELEPVR